MHGLSALGSLCLSVPGMVPVLSGADGTGEERNLAVAPPYAAAAQPLGWLDWFEYPV